MVTEFIEENGTNPEMDEFVTPLADIGNKVQRLTMDLGMKAMANRDEVGAAAVPYLRVVGHLVYSYFWARMAKVAVDRVKADGGTVDPFYRHKLATAGSTFSDCCPRRRC